MALSDAEKRLKNTTVTELTTTRTDDTARGILTYHRLIEEVNGQGEEGCPDPTRGDLSQTHT